MTLMASHLAAEFGLDLHGEDRPIVGPGRLAEARPGELTWLLTLGDSHRAWGVRLQGVTVVTPVPADPNERAFVVELASRCAVLLMTAPGDPRLLFARILAARFAHLELQIPAGVDPSARIDESAVLGRNVTVGAFCYIGPGVEIGDDTVLHPGVVIHSRTVVGRRCILGSHCVVGGRGFGFVPQADGSLVHFPHTGRVVLEDDVELQAATTVARPGLGETRVSRGAKIDSHVHVGHGARIGPHAMVAAHAEVGAEVVLGEGAWLGPNSCTLERISIGPGAFVGLGATVLASVPPGQVVAGSPAEPTAELRRKRAAVRRLLQDPENGAR